MSVLTNNLGIPLPAAVWLANDTYDYVDDPNYISATTLLRPIRQIVIPPTIPQEEIPPTDISELVSSRMGTAIHDAIEKAWLENYDQALLHLGVPQSVIDRFIINPTDEQMTQEGVIPIWMEIRTNKEIDGIRIGGKFDFIADYVLHDFKSTSVFSWVYGTRDEEYKLQGSLYRWLNPDKVKSDYIRIIFIFKDWSSKQVGTNPNYPPSPIWYKDIPLMSLEETEEWVRNKIALIKRWRGQEEKYLPLCTKEELWMSDPVYKYYSKPESAAQGKRATKNFDSYVEATKWQMEKGGVIVTVEGEPKRCGWCPAQNHCSQKRELIKDD